MSRVTKMAQSSGIIIIIINSFFIEGYTVNN